MGKLIDADALKEKVFFTDFGKAVFERDIDAMPSVDAVEVVRCKDCRNYCHLVGSCKYFDFMPVKEDDFCSHGY